MAKRNIRKTDSETTTTPEPAQAASNGTPKPARERRKAVKPVVAARAAEVAPVTAPAAVESPAPLYAEPRRGEITLSHEQIALRAYHIFLERGGRPGDQLADWVTAERQLREQLVGQSA
jgi:Protein of unknown function (DUF2934)